MPKSSTQEFRDAGATASSSINVSTGSSRGVDLNFPGSAHGRNLTESQFLSSRVGGSMKLLEAPNVITLFLRSPLGGGWGGGKESRDSSPIATCREPAPVFPPLMWGGDRRRYVTTGPFRSSR